MHKFDACRTNAAFLSDCSKTIPPDKQFAFLYYCCSKRLMSFDCSNPFTIDNSTVHAGSTKCKKKIEPMGFIDDVTTPSFI